MDVRAAVAFQAGKPLEVTVTSPGKGNLRLTIDWLSSHGQSKPQVVETKVAA